MSEVQARTPPSPEGLIRVYQESETVAIVGASTDEAKPGHYIPAYLQSQGYRIVPVNPRGSEIFRQHTFKSLREIDMPVDVVDVFRPPREAEAIARDAIAIDAKVLWFQPGTETQEAVDIARDAGLFVVARYCMGATHRALRLGPGPHRPRVVRRSTGR
jgi:predicted CoA-binding protein